MAAVVHFSVLGVAAGGGTQVSPNNGVANLKGGPFIDLIHRQRLLRTGAIRSTSLVADAEPRSAGGTRNRDGGRRRRRQLLVQSLPWRRTRGYSGFVRR